MISDSSRPVSLKIKKTFEAKVRKGLKNSAYQSGTAPLLVGFSGGADSTALLLSIKSVLSDSQPLCAVHVDHGLRGNLSKRDAEHTENVCRQYGIDFCYRRVHVSGISHLGLEGAARESRRSAFLAVAREMGADTFALAHSMNDQAETVLMRLFEGAGVRGISGMKWRTLIPSNGMDDLYIIRPFLGVSREEIMEYLRAQGVSWVEDETNEDESRLRNRIRKKIIPAIREYIGDAAIAGIAKSARVTAPIITFMDEMSRDLNANYIHEDNGKLVVTPLEEVKTLDPALRAEFWRSVLAMLADVSSVHIGRRALWRWIEGLDAMVMSDKPSGVLNLVGILEARREYDRLIFGYASLHSELLEVARLKIPGKTVHRSLRLVIEASYDLSHYPCEVWEARLDAAKLGEGAVVRTRRNGDRFHPLGREKSRKLKDYFIEKKIPKPRRDQVPLLAHGNKIAWIIGHQVSAEFVLDGGENRGVTLKVLPESGDAKQLSSLAQ